MVPEIYGFVSDLEEEAEIPTKKKNTKKTKKKQGISKKRARRKSGWADAVEPGPSEAALSVEADARAARAHRRSSASNARSSDQA